MIGCSYEWSGSYVELDKGRFPVKRLFVAAVLVVVMAMFSQCSDNPVDTGGGGGGGSGTKADSIALAWFQAMADTMKAMDGREMEEVRDADFSTIRNGFNEALGIESHNSIAHMGLSIMEVLEINYSSDVWEVIDSLAALGGSGGVPPPQPGPPRGGLLGREYSLLVEVPFAMYVKQAMDFPSNLTIGNIQNIITNTIIPALNRSINHLQTCEQNADTVITLVVEDEGIMETVIIDLGEIYVFDAAIHALRAAFRMATAYDVDLFGPDGTYDWIEDMVSIDQGGPLPESCAYYERVPGVSHDTLYLYWSDRSRGEAMVDSIMFSVLHYNLEDRTNFLRLREGGSVLEAAHQDMLNVISKLESSVYFIKYVREGETEHNVIKLSDLTGMESDLGDPYGPNFAKNFSTIEDVLEWVEDFISGPMEFTEDIGSPPMSLTWTMDISSLLLSPVQDWNSLLPYHRWSIPAGPWIQYYEELRYMEDWDPVWTYWAYVYDAGWCDYREFIGITYIYQYGFGYGIDLEGVLELLDGPNGDPIDLMIEGFPYMPDYTLHGLFPEMTRQSWLDLISMLD
jgi:hypothetical protein